MRTMRVGGTANKLISQLSLSRQSETNDHDVKKGYAEDYQGKCE